MGIVRKLGHSIRKHKNEVAVSVATMAVPVITAVSSFAAEPDIKAVMTSAMDTMKVDIVEMIAAVLPAGLTVMGITLAVAYGIKFFRKITAK